MVIIENLLDMCCVYLSSANSLLNNSLAISGSFVPIRRAVTISFTFKWVYVVKTWWRLQVSLKVFIVHRCLLLPCISPKKRRTKPSQYLELNRHKKKGPSLPAGLPLQEAITAVLLFHHSAVSHPFPLYICQGAYCKIQEPSLFPSIQEQRCKSHVKHWYVLEQAATKELRSRCLLDLFLPTWNWGVQGKLNFAGSHGLSQLLPWYLRNIKLRT